MNVNCKVFSGNNLNDYISKLGSKNDSAKIIMSMTNVPEVKKIIETDN